MNKEAVLAKLKGCVENDLKIKLEGTDQDLIGGKILDSFSMLMLISFIKKEYGVQLNMEQLDFSAFNSISTLADLILKEAGSRSST